MKDVIAGQLEYLPQAAQEHGKDLRGCAEKQKTSDMLRGLVDRNTRCTVPHAMIS
jgi:hypothetical protein